MTCSLNYKGDVEVSWVTLSGERVSRTFNNVVNGYYLGGAGEIVGIEWDSDRVQTKAASIVNQDSNGKGTIYFFLQYEPGLSKFVYWDDEGWPIWVVASSVVFSAAPS